MLIRKLKTLAALAAASTMLIVTSIVMVSVFSAPVRSAQPPQEPSVRPPAAKRDPAPGPRAVPPEEVVVVAVTKSRYQRSTSQPGTVEPFEQVDVLPTASGVLGRLTVDLGSAVKRGDVLAEVEALELGLDVERSEAAVRQARARLRTGDARVKVAESAVKSAVADVEAARTQSQAAVGQRSYREKQYQRIEELVKRGSVEHRLGDEEHGRLEAARSAEAAAGAQLAVVQANVANAEARLVAAMAERDEMKEGLQPAEIDIQKARLAVDACRIRAPLDGYVVARRGHVGEFVRSAAGGGSTPIVTIAQTRVVRIVAGVPDRAVPFVGIGDPAVFTPEALGTPFKGKVSRLAEVEDPHDRTMRVEIDLQNPDGRLRPGMYGRVAIELATGPEALSVPSAAVGRGTGAAAEFFCYRVVDGRTVRTPIWVAHEDSERAWITRGLNEGDLVVADVAKLREGEEVKPARDGGRPGEGGQR